MSTVSVSNKLSKTYVLFVSVFTDVTQWCLPVWCIWTHVPETSVNLVCDTHFWSSVLNNGALQVSWNPSIWGNYLDNIVCAWFMMSDVMHFLSVIIFLSPCFRMPTHGTWDKMSSCICSTLKSSFLFFMGRLWSERMVCVVCVSVIMVGRSGLSSIWMGIREKHLLRWLDINQLVKLGNDLRQTDDSDHVRIQCDLFHKTV